MRTLLIDVMGTLVALEPPVEPLRRELAARFGIAVSAAEAERALACEIRFYRAHMATGRDAASLRALHGACAETLRGALPALAGLPRRALVDTLLAALRFRAQADAAPALRAVRAAGVERVVAVSNWDCSLPEVLERVGLRRALDGAVASATAGAAKPSVAIFGLALDVAGASASEAVHVGDTPTEDVAGARAAGIAPVLLARDGPPAVDPGCPVIGGLRELAPLLRAYPPQQV